MKIIRRAAILGSVAIAILFADMAPLPVDIGLVPNAEAVLGRQRRTRRRGLAVGYTAGKAAASASASEQQAATNDQQAATAQQQSATAQQQSATAEQQAAAAQPAPTELVTSLPDGCVSAGNVFQCGNTYYKPYMSGNQVVYGVVPAPQ